jgi:hypothetical protein
MFQTRSSHKLARVGSFASQVDNTLVPDFLHMRKGGGGGWGEGFLATRFSGQSYSECINQSTQQKVIKLLFWLSADSQVSDWSKGVDKLCRDPRIFQLLDLLVAYKNIYYFIQYYYT